MVVAKVYNICDKMTVKLQWHSISNNDFKLLLLKIFIIMTLIKYNKNFPSILDEFFNDGWSLFDDVVPAKGLSHFTPLGDVIETDDAFNVEIMLPGFEKKEIKMEVEDNSLIIEAERKKSEEKYNRVESHFGKFRKSYTLPDYVDVEAIDAKYKNGVLKVTIPKVEEKIGSKLIEIK